MRKSHGQYLVSSVNGLNIFRLQDKNLGSSAYTLHGCEGGQTRKHFGNIRLCSRLCSHTMDSEYCLLTMDESCTFMTHNGFRWLFNHLSFVGQSLKYEHSLRMRKIFCTNVSTFTPIIKTYVIWPKGAYTFWLISSIPKKCLMNTLTSGLFLQGLYVIMNLLLSDQLGI